MYANKFEEALEMIGQLENAEGDEKVNDIEKYMLRQHIVVLQREITNLNAALRRKDHSNRNLKEKVNYFKDLLNNQQSPSSAEDCYFGYEEEYNDCDTDE